MNELLNISACLFIVCIEMVRGHDNSLRILNCIDMHPVNTVTAF